MPLHDIRIGDCRTVLETLPDRYFQTCVTSPPYYGLRDYKHANQIGLESTLDEYVANLVNIFREVRRVLRDDGTLWLNLGDSYASQGGSGVQGISGQRASPTFTARNTSNKGIPKNAKPKDLLGVPWMVAFALRADGWYLRSDIIWHKPNPMPESIKDRPVSSHEHIFLLSKNPAYYYDAEALKEAAVTPAGTKGAKGSVERSTIAGVNSRPPEYAVYDGTRNVRNVWKIATRPYRGAHFATFPLELPVRCIKGGTSEAGQCIWCSNPYVRMVERTPMEVRKTNRYDAAGVSHARTALPTSRTIGWRPGCSCPQPFSVPQCVLDPFYGAGTTGLAAFSLGRRSIGIEINAEYAALARSR